MTLPQHDWAFDLGFGIAHIPNNPADPNDSFGHSLGQGFNIEAAVAVGSAVQLGLRTGLRFGNPARFNGPAGADAYGRPFDTETYGTGTNELANPEFYVRGALVRGGVVELGLEGHIYTPLGGELGVMLGIPLTFHIGSVARIDTGAYLPFYFGVRIGQEGDANVPARAIISLPLHLWFQLTNELWLGPLLGVRFFDCPDRFYSDCGDRVSLPLGFGLGYQISRVLDFKTQMIFQDVANGKYPSEPSRGAYWGLGAGVEVRVE